VSAARTSITRQARRALFYDAVAVMRAECERELSVDDVARRIATSRRQLQRVFCEVAGTTFREYLAQVRLERAAELAREHPRRPLQDIARQVGYRSASSFSAAFRRHHGVPPSALRRNGAARAA
jgi:two-component system response regulator YesN